jgi:hypothetical protein
MGAVEHRKQDSHEELIYLRSARVLGNIELWYALSEDSTVFQHWDGGSGGANGRASSDCSCLRECPSKGIVAHFCRQWREYIVVTAPRLPGNSGAI